MYSLYSQKLSSGSSNATCTFLAIFSCWVAVSQPTVTSYVPAYRQIRPNTSWTVLQILPQTSRRCLLPLH